LETKYNFQRQSKLIILYEKAFIFSPFKALTKKYLCAGEIERIALISTEVEKRTFKTPAPQQISSTQIDC
jgi:hypothetical protein